MSTTDKKTRQKATKMNAERFDSKEYTENIEAVDFIRVCQLVVGQHFLLNGTWRRVTRKNDTTLYYKYLYSVGTDKKNTVGVNSKQFVQVVKHKINQ